MPVATMNLQLNVLPQRPEVLRQCGFPVSCKVRFFRTASALEHVCRRIVHSIRPLEQRKDEGPHLAPMLQTLIESGRGWEMRFNLLVLSPAVI